MLVAVSPYHLTTREPAAMASLLLATGVVTLLPAPGDGSSRASVGAAAGRVPTYLRMLESWSWSEDLWRQGVVDSMVQGRDAMEDVRDARDLIVRDPRYAALAAFLRPELQDDADAFLRAVSRDILRAGPDPGVCVPLLAGLDRFAARQGLIVARGEPASTAQRLEEGLARSSGAFAMPALLRAGAHAILAARDALHAPLAAVRGAIAEVCAGGPGSPSADALALLRAASLELTSAFGDARAALARAQDPDEESMQEGVVRVTLQSLPCDAALESSRAAASALMGQRPPDASPPLPIQRDELAGRRVWTMVFRVISRRPLADAPRPAGTRRP